MRFGILTQWYDPEPGPASLPGVLARGLGKRGHDVQVVTGFPNYPLGKLAPGYRIRWRADELCDGVRVRRVALYPSHDRSIARRMLNYTSLAASALAWGTSALRGVDAVWVNGSPITIGLPMWGVRYRFGVPVVLHVLDLWPDTVLSSGFVGRRGYHGVETALHAWCRRMYRCSDRVAYISPGVGPRLADRGVPAAKLAYAPMWADELVVRPAAASMRAQLGLGEDDVALLYAGTLGHTQGLEALIEACARIDDPRFVCLLAGSGVAERSLRDLAQRLGLTNVRFLGRLPKERISDVMATGDLHYIGLRPDSSSGVTMPSKVQATLAAGRAMLVAVDGDAADVARDSGAGFPVVPGDPQAIAVGIRVACRLGRSGLAQLGHAGRAYYLRTFSEDVGIDRIERLLLDVAARKEVTCAA